MILNHAVGSIGILVVIAAAVVRVAEGADCLETLAWPGERPENSDDSAH